MALTWFIGLMYEFIERILINCRKLVMTENLPMPCPWVGIKKKNINKGFSFIFTSLFSVIYVCWDGNLCYEGFSGYSFYSWFIFFRYLFPMHIFLFYVYSTFSPTLLYFLFFCFLHSSLQPQGQHLRLPKY